MGVRTPGAVSRLRALTDEYRQLAERLRAGGGAARVAKMHQQGKLAPRERVTKLLDPDTPWLELGLLVAYDQYDGQAPGAGVITGVGVVEGREVVVVANDATVKAGSWWPETIRKILRAQEVAMRQRIPIVYGQTWRLWRGQFESQPPFPIDDDTVLVAYYASAELGCFKALGWPQPRFVLDLFTEFRARTNGAAERRQA